MYGLPIVSPDITVYVSGICVTRMETRISITRFLSKHKRIILSMIKHEKVGVAGQQHSTRYGVSDLVHTQKSIIELGLKMVLSRSCTMPYVLVRALVLVVSFPDPTLKEGKGPRVCQALLRFFAY